MLLDVCEVSGKSIAQFLAPTDPVRRRTPLRYKIKHSKDKQWLVWSLMPLRSMANDTDMQAI